MRSDDMASLVLALLLLLLLFTFSDIVKRFEQSTSSIIGDKFELVDDVFDDTDDNGDSGDIGDSDEIDDEQPSRDDDGDIFSLQIRAVNTSSSSISESELGGFETGGTGSLPAARKLCSSSSNWPMKFKFGDIIGRASLTNLYASISDSDL